MIGRTETFGKYTLIERLAIGGMAEIFKAKTLGVDGFEKLLAIKRLHSHLCADQDFAMMLADEAKIAVQLNHANIGQIFDLGRIDSQYFIVMEYINGIDLHQLLRQLRKQKQRLPVEIATYVLMQTLQGLHYAHTKEGHDGHLLEIVHRDVSPQNVMLSRDGEVKLVDFGIAKARMRAQETQAGIIKGKFYYMAPEQAYGHHVDARTDVFAVGIILYEMLAGRNPYEGSSDADLLKRVRQVDFQPLSQVTRVHPPLARIVDRAVERNPELRYQSALAFQRALSQYTTEHGTHLSRVELSEFVRTSQGRPAQESKRPDSALMLKNDYSANEASVIFDASEVDDNPFADDEKTRVFSRSQGDDLELDEPSGAGETAIIDLPDLPPPPPRRKAGPFAEPTWDDAQVDHQRLQQNKRSTTQRGPFAALSKQQQIYLAAALTVVVVLGVLILVLTSGGGDDVTSGETPGLSASVEGRSAELPAKRNRTTTQLPVSTTPANARVFVDGEARGTTPVAIGDLEIGRTYTMSFKRQGHAEKTLQVVAEGQMDPLVVELEPVQGILKITTYPAGAMVLLNDEELGAAPVTAMGLSQEETHTIVAHFQDGTSMERKVNWRDDDDRVLEVDLNFEGVNVVQADPDPIPRAATTPRKTQRSPRATRVIQPFAKASPDKTEATPKTKKTQGLNIWDLDKKDAHGTLTVRVSSGEGRVYVDGKMVRDAPLIKHSLKPGTYMVEVYFPTLKRRSAPRRVTIRSGETSTLNISP